MPAKTALVSGVSGQYTLHLEENQSAYIPIGLTGLMRELRRKTGSEPE